MVMRWDGFTLRAKWSWEFAAASLSRCKSYLKKVRSYFYILFNLRKSWTVNRPLRTCAKHLLFVGLTEWVWFFFNDLTLLIKKTHLFTRLLFIPYFTFSLLQKTGLTTRREIIVYITTTRRKCIMLVCVIFFVLVFFFLHHNYYILLHRYIHIWCK